MKFAFTVKNYEVTEKLRKITEQKLSKLDKYFTGVEAFAKVKFKKQTCEVYLILIFSCK